MVSVLTTTYNREDFVAEAVESVLASSYGDFEYIIVDDCSKDGTVEILEEYRKLDGRIRFYKNEKNLGDYNNRNKAAGYATRKYIKYLDSDDIMYNHCLQAMVYSMSKFPEAGFGLSAKGDPSVAYPVCLSPRQIYLEHFNGYGHLNRAPGSAIIQRKAFEAVGGFTGARYIGDIELWFTLAQRYSLVKFPVDLYWARSHGHSEGAIEKGADTAELRRSLIQRFLNSPQCPVTAEEIKVPFTKKIKQSLARIL